MAIARFLDRMFLALQASGLWLQYAALQNLIPSFPRIAPGWRAWGRNPSGNLSVSGVLVTLLGGVASFFRKLVHCSFPSLLPSLPPLPLCSRLWSRSVGRDFSKASDGGVFVRVALALPSKRAIAV